MVDSIHPPDLILLNMDNIDDFPDNSSSAPLPDSPLSTPPDSPHRVGTDDDVKEEEKKEEEQGSTKGDAGWEEAPLDECIENNNSTKNGRNNAFSNDESRIVSKVDVSKESTDKDRRKFQSESRVNVTSKPFDEEMKTTQKVKTVGDLESAPDDEKKVDVTDEPPSLSLVEEAKKRLSAQGLSMDTEVMALPSSKSQSPSKVEKKTENTSCDESNIFNPDGCIDEPPSLSRVEEAMKRTSMMVLKHNNKRDHSDHIKNATPASADPSGMIQMASSTATKIDEINVESSESNRLAALRRDIMSLKSSLSDMNMKLREEHSETQRTIALGENASNKIESNEGKIKVEHSQKSDETNTRSRSPNAEKFNDIPFATISGNAASTELSPPKTNTSIKDCETSFEQSAAVVSPDGEIVNEKLEDNPAFVASNNTSLHRNDCHVVPLDEVDEIMTSKNCILSVSKEREKMSEYEDPDLNITMETTASSLSQEKPSNTRFETITSYREMTPKKDLQGSDKSARWLQEELRRRVVVKRDINSAIEARGQYDIERDDTNGYNKLIAGDLPSISSPPDMQNSQSTMDEEVAAITANDERNRSTKNRSIDISSSYDEQEPPSLSKTDVNKNISRKLDYGDFEERPHDELMGTNNISEGGIGYQGFRPVFDYQDIQHEMKKFASETRAALREQSFTEVAMQPSSSAMPVESTTKTRNYESIRIDFAAMEAGEAPKMLISMDSFDGIASGDIFLSLLSENTGRAETSTAATWADRVHGAIWRARRMRKSRMKSSDLPSQPLVRGGSQTVDSIQQAALVHLKHDEIDDSINLVEGIAFAYYSYFERSLDLREKNPSAETSKGIMDFKPYIGMALHNLGVLNLLKGDYDEALSYFSRAVENRKGNLGEDHPHYIVSLIDFLLFMR